MEATVKQPFSRYAVDLQPGDKVEISSAAEYRALRNAGKISGPTNTAQPAAVKPAAAAQSTKSTASTKP